MIGKNLLQKMKHGSVLIDHTTSEPSLARQLAVEANKHGIVSLDCPVTGGDTGAKNGVLSILCGGSESGFQSVEESVLGHYGKAITRFGEAG